MSLYIDVSILVSFFVADDLTLRADRFFHGRTSALFVSDFVEAEFASAVSRRVRTRELRASVARRVLADFDAWVARTTTLIATSNVDIVAATAYLRRLDLNLRTADAIHIAIAQRISATLATFDDDMAHCAEVLGVPVAAR